MEIASMGNCAPSSFSAPMRNLQAPSVTRLRYGQRAYGKSVALGWLRSATTWRPASNTTTFMLVLPISKTATQSFMRSAAHPYPSPVLRQTQDEGEGRVWDPLEV